MTLLPLLRRTSLYNKPRFIQPIFTNRPTCFFFFSFFAVIIFVCSPSLMYLIISLEWMQTKLWLCRSKTTRRIWACLSDSLRYEACCPLLPSSYPFPGQEKSSWGSCFPPDWADPAKRERCVSANHTSIINQTGDLRPWVHTDIL